MIVINFKKCKNGIATGNPVFMPFLRVASLSRLTYLFHHLQMYSRLRYAEFFRGFSYCGVAGDYKVCNFDGSFFDIGFQPNCPLKYFAPYNICRGLCVYEKTAIANDVENSDCRRECACLSRRCLRPRAIANSKVVCDARH